MKYKVLVYFKKAKHWVPWYSEDSKDCALSVYLGLFHLSPVILVCDGRLIARSAVYA